MKDFNIFGKIRDELKDFFENKISIAGATVDGKKIKGYDFNQFERLQAIEYMDASVFLSTDKDSEGQQKFFINEASFYREVSSKNIDIDLKHFLFVPEEDQSEKGLIILRKKFRKWAKEQGLSTLLNDSVDRFPKYGTIVVKRVGKNIEIVPLITLRNQQDARSLAESSFVIEEHNGMTLSKMDKFPDWDLSDLDMEWDDEITVYERYGEVPLSFYKEYKGQSVKKGDEKKTIHVQCIVTFDKVKYASAGGAILFMEEADCPYLEVHYGRQDGRWLGIGEMEKQLENQYAFNMVFNMMKKGLSWSVKNIFQTQDDTVINNLVREVKDGDVLKIDSVDGIRRVDTQSRSNAEATNIYNLLEKNSDQRAFAFEAATGEGFNSGTPFRLGAIVGQSVQAYYSLKREKLGILWKNVIFDFMLPTFINQTEKEFVEGICDTEEGFEELRGAKIDWAVTQEIINKVLSGDDIDPVAIRAEVEQKLANKSRDYWKFTREEMKNLKYRFDLDITGESMDIPQKIETLTTLYTTLAQQGDPSSQQVLKRIMILAGEKMPKQVPQAQPMGTMGQSPKMETMMQGQAGETANQVGANL
jgi:hypothetical protein